MYFMIKKKLVIILFLVMVLAFPLQTSAVSTHVTLEITGGVLTISVPADPVYLGTLVDTVEGGTISAPLGEVQVSDARNAAAGSGWVASVISTAFTPAAGPAIAASAISYGVGPITKVGTATYTANDPSDLTAVSPAVTATGITGNNSATWNPTIVVIVPGGMAPGEYTATITHSVI